MTGTDTDRRSWPAALLAVSAAMLLGAILLGEARFISLTLLISGGLGVVVGVGALARSTQEPKLKGIDPGAIVATFVVVVIAALIALAFVIGVH